MPIRTGLAVLTFIALLLLPQYVPALEKYKTFDPAMIPLVVDLPVKGPPLEPGVDPNNEEFRINRLQATAPKNLIDPAHELDNFYEALLKGGTTRIVHYGDSPTTGDLITADARAALQKQFGDAGSGFALMARPWAWYNHRGVEMEGSGWGIDIAGATEVKDGMHGLGGASFRGSPGATARFNLRNSHNVVEIAYLSQPDGGDFTVEADGSTLGTVETAAESKTPGFSAFNIPSGAKKFVIRVTRGAVRVYGADFRRSGGGVVYHSLGVNGANVTLLSRSFSGPHWTAELRHYKPDLVIINYGTNESGYPSFVEGTWGLELKNAVKRVQDALPGTSILLMSPMDRGERKPDGKIDTITAMPRLVKIEAGIGQDTGVAFFNTFQAMGGPGTMGRWYASEPRLVGADFIHPMPAGAKIVGELLYSALRDGYNDYKLRQLNKASVQTASKE
jgi:lysophospholipase L1-like esterase